MKIFPATLLTVLLALAELAQADLLSGQTEYETALESRKAGLYLAEEHATKTAAELNSPEFEIVAAQMKSIISNYRKQIEASAEHSFAPAQYLLAQILSIDSQKADQQKEEICRLLKEAAAQNLLAAIHTQIMYCSPSPLLFNIDSEASIKAIKPLEKALTKEDPYTKFYPFPTFKSPICFQPDHPEANLKLNTPIQLGLQRAKPNLDFEQFQAESHFFLAMSQHQSNPSKAKDHADKARSLGCLETNNFFPK